MKGAALLSVFVLVMSVSGTAIYDPNDTQDDSNDKVRTLSENPAPEENSSEEEEIEEVEKEVQVTSSESQGFIQKIVQALTSLF